MSFESTLDRWPRSLEEAFLDEGFLPSGTDSVVRSAILDALGFRDNNPYVFARERLRPGQATLPMPDLTISRVTIGAVEDGQVRRISWSIDDFDWNGNERFTLKPDRAQNSPVAVDRLRYWFSDEGQCVCGTSILFEDVVGHLAPPEVVSATG